MKKTIAALSLLVIWISLFCGCSKTIPGSSSDRGSMTATVGGVAFTATYCSVNGLATGSPSTDITGVGPNNTSITLHINQPEIATGTFSMNNTGTQASGYYSIGNNGTVSDRGTVTISTITVGANITGTFNFVCVDGTAVSGGTFRAVF